MNLQICWDYFVLLTLTFKLVSAGGVHMFKQDVAKSNILKEIFNTTISTCYKQCWQNENDCVAVGFLLHEINNKHMKSLYCYMITTTQVNGGGTESLTLDVLETPRKLDIACSTFQTNFSEYQNSVIYLDRHNVSCPSGNALNMFQLENSDPTLEYRYNYKCCAVQMNCITSHEQATAMTTDSSPYDLDKQYFSCQHNYLSSFRLWRNLTIYRDIHYLYRCCQPFKLPSSKLTCVDNTNAWTSSSNGDTSALNLQKVECQKHYFIRSFVLESDRNLGKWRYLYTCCKYGV